MRKRIIMGAILSLGLAVLGSPAQCGENAKVPGLWKVVDFHTEDIVTKERVYPYGQHPIGYMKLETDGRSYAWLASGWPADQGQLVSKDAATSGVPPAAYQATFYSGRYRLNGAVLRVYVERSEHEGLVGSQPLDLAWTEGRTRQEELRHFVIETDGQEREILRIETAPMRNPNGASNTIVGRSIWARSSDWEFGEPH